MIPPLVVLVGGLHSSALELTNKLPIQHKRFILNLELTIDLDFGCSPVVIHSPVDSDSPSSTHNVVPSPVIIMHRDLILCMGELVARLQ